VPLEGKGGVRVRKKDQEDKSQMFAGREGRGTTPQKKKKNSSTKELNAPNNRPAQKKKSCAVQRS